MEGRECSEWLRILVWTAALDGNGGTSPAWDARPRRPFQGCTAPHSCLVCAVVQEIILFLSPPPLLLSLSLPLSHAENDRYQRHLETLSRSFSKSKKPNETPPNTGRNPVRHPLLLSPLLGYTHRYFWIHFLIILDLQCYIIFRCITQGLDMCVP